MDLSAAGRREHLSTARVARHEAEAALRDRIRRERVALKGAARRPISEHYRDFLQERAQTGDGPSITYEVRVSGEVDYLKDGAAFLVDEGRTLRLWSSERDAIEIALRRR